MRHQEHHSNPVSLISSKYNMVNVTIIITIIINIRAQDPIGNIFFI